MFLVKFLLFFFIIKDFQTIVFIVISSTLPQLINLMFLLDSDYYLVIRVK